MLNRFLRDESGSTAIEYALIGALISVAIVGAVTALAEELGALFGYIYAQVSAAL
jgi:pilus assembly protein Flp/PilA